MGFRNPRMAKTAQSGMKFTSDSVLTLRQCVSPVGHTPHSIDGQILIQSKGILFSHFFSLKSNAAET